MREALWLRPPRDPKTGRVGGRVWWWLLPFLILFALEQALPGISGPSPRDFSKFVSHDSGKDFFSGAWGWYAVVVVLAIFNTVLGEELLFRGLLLPRMRGVFGRGDWVANGVLFAVYHLHTPWVIPTACGTPSLSPIPHEGSRARGWGSSCIRLRASSSSSSPSLWCTGRGRVALRPLPLCAKSGRRI